MLLVALSSNEVPCERHAAISHGKTVCMVGVSGSRQLQTNDMVVGSVLTKNHLDKVPGVKEL